MACRIRIAAPALLLALALGGCTTRAGDLAYDPPGFHAPDPLPPAEAMAQRQLTQGDTVTITVFELGAVSGDEIVDAAGNISVPLVGKLPAEGRTIPQFTGDLTAALAAKYLQSPHVIVTLKDAAQKTVTVDGAVRVPGVYSVTPNTSLMQVIANAKGPADTANIKRVVIFRTIGGVREGAAFDLTTIRKGKDVDPPVYPNDLVVVDGTNLPAAYSLLLKSLRLVGFAAIVM